MLKRSMRHPLYLVLLIYFGYFHTSLVEPLVFVESASKIIFLEMGWSTNLKTTLSPFILYFTTNRKLNFFSLNQNGTLFYIILMLYYLYIKIILICTPYNIINYRQIWLFSAGFFRFQIKMNVFDQNHGEIGHFCIEIM